MKKVNLKFLGLAWIMLFFTACSNDDDTTIEEEAIIFKDMESDWVRLTLLREGAIDVMQANTSEIKHTVEGALAPEARYYQSHSGQYLTQIDRNANKVRFFDSGIVNHEDHGHDYSAKWLNLELENILPTHYSDSQGHIVIFNDGEGSFTYVNESQLEIPAYQPQLFKFDNTVAHHGAGFRLDNGQFVITFKNTTEPGGLPQTVKFIDANGTIIEDNKSVEVTGIHGNATNGEFGVFGATDGVILVDNQGTKTLIGNVGELNSESGNWLGTMKGHYNSDVFFARSRNLGVFLLNPEDKTLSNIYKGADVLNHMYSFDGEYYLLHTEGNVVHIFDGDTGEKITSRAVEMANIPVLTDKNRSETEVLAKMEEPSPVLVCSDKFLYVLTPGRNQVKVLEIKSLKHVHTIDLPYAVDGIQKNGFSIEGEQNPDYTH